MHLSEADLLRAAGAGEAEVERMAAHLGVCPGCRALAARFLEDRALPVKREAPLRMLLDLAAFERQAAVERLLARAEFSDLCRQKRVPERNG